MQLLMHPWIRTGFLSALAIGMIPTALASPEKAWNDLNRWSKQQIEGTFRGCASKTAESVFSKLKSLEFEYSGKVDAIPLNRLAAMPQDSDFIEMGQVLFPAMLPKRYPAKLAYMACDEEHRDFMASKTPEEFKENLNELRDCFERSYRIGMPKLVAVVLGCYQELPGK